MSVPDVPDPVLSVRTIIGKQSLYGIGTARNFAVQSARKELDALSD